MKAKRKRRQASSKAQVGLEGLTGEKTVAEIAREYPIHPVQVSQWKRAIIDRLPELFETGSRSPVETSEREVARLEQKVGQRTMDLDWLKKSPFKWACSFPAPTGPGRPGLERAAAVRVVGNQSQWTPKSKARGLKDTSVSWRKLRRRSTLSTRA